VTTLTMADYFLPLIRKKTKRDFDPLHKILSEWHGKENAANEIIQKLPVTEHISSGVDEALKTLLSKDVALLQKIQRNWEKIAGKQLAQYMTPANMRDNTLYLEVSHPAWLMEFKKKEQDMLLNKIREILGCKEFRKIKLVPVGKTRKNVQRKN